MKLKNVFLCIIACLATQLQAKESSFEYTADYVVVGAGAAGCTVAARLAEAGYSVIVLEAGPDTSLESNDILVQFDKTLMAIPLNFQFLYNRFNVDPNSANCGNWNATQTMAAYITPDQNGIYYAYPRGLGAGGSTQHSALQDGIGSLQVYDNIAKTVKDKAWCGKNIHRLFKKMETALFTHDGSCGSDGWLSIQHSAVEAPLFTDLSDEIVAATGVPFLQNFCSPCNAVAGVGNASVQVKEDGTRASVYEDLLVPIMNETGKIQVFFNTLVSEVILDKTQGDCKNKYRAVGVKGYNKAYLEEVQSGSQYVVVGTDPDCTAIRVDDTLPSEAIRFLAREEVIISGGAIQTPQLLMLSGIGPKEHLESVGIKTKLDLPGVGTDLLDHCELSNVYEIDPLKFITTWQAHILLTNPGIADNPAIEAVALQAATTYPEFLNTNTASIQWDWFSAGQPPAHQKGCYPFPDMHSVPYAGFHFDFDLTLAGPLEPDFYFDFPRRYQVPDINDPFNQVGVPEKGNLVNAQFQVGENLNPRVYVSWLIENMKPKLTRGTIRLASSDPRQSPIIDERLFEDDDAIGRMADMVLQIRAVMAPLEATYAIANQPWELFPGPNVVTREDIIEYIKLWSSYGHHISGTCQMGAKDPKTGKRVDENSVLDSRCRVFGVDNLRVADTSVYVKPWIHAFNTSRAGFVVGEQVADFLINDE